LLDVDVPASELLCTSMSNPNRWAKCRLRDPSVFAASGLQRIDLLLPPHIGAQRNNAQLRINARRLDIPATFGPDLELTVEAASETYRDDAVLTPSKSGRQLTYAHAQGDP
jgi:hypothetical protein